jgi:hypothetical protein
MLKCPMAGPAQNVAKLIWINLKLIIRIQNTDEICLCDVTLSVYPHRAGLKNMPGHGGIRACPVWIHTQSNIAQASYSPEYITPTQQ